MGTRTIRYTALLACIAALTACTAPPEPPVASPGPELDPQAVNYDNLDFVKSRPAVFDNKCGTLPRDLQSVLGLESKPADGMGGGCTAREPWGNLSIHLFSPMSNRKSRAQYFSDAWNGDLGAGGYFQRSILLDRYYAVTKIAGSVNDNCTVTVDTGSERPFEVTASMDFDESIALSAQESTSRSTAPCATSAPGPGRRRRSCCRCSTRTAAAGRAEPQPASRLLSTTSETARSVSHTTSDEIVCGHPAPSPAMCQAASSG
jgi:hypothetical protein